MFEDISNAIKATLYERVSSPFISSFVLSWCVFNYKILFILFSNMETRYKFYEIEVLQLQPQKFLGVDFPFYPYVFLFPFFTAAFYTLVFPFIEVGLTFVWMKGQKLVKSTKISIEDETPVSQEKYTALLKKIRQMDRDYGDDLARKDNECKLEIDLAAHKQKQLEDELKDLGSLLSNLEIEKNQVLEREKKLQYMHDVLLKKNEDALRTIAKLKQQLEDNLSETNALKAQIEEKNKLLHTQSKNVGAWIEPVNNEQHRNISLGKIISNPNVTIGSHEFFNDGTLSINPSTNLPDVASSNKIYLNKKKT